MNVLARRLALCGLSVPRSTCLSARVHSHLHARRTISTSLPRLLPRNSDNNGSFELFQYLLSKSSDEDTRINYLAALLYSAKNGVERKTVSDVVQDYEVVIDDLKAKLGERLLDFDQNSMNELVLQAQHSLEDGGVVLPDTQTVSQEDILELLPKNVTRMRNSLDFDLIATLLNDTNLPSEKLWNTIIALYAAPKNTEQHVYFAQVTTQFRRTVENFDEQLMTRSKSVDATKIEELIKEAESLLDSPSHKGKVEEIRSRFDGPVPEEASFSQLSAAVEEWLNGEPISDEKVLHFVAGMLKLARSDEQVDFLDNLVALVARRIPKFADKLEETVTKLSSRDLNVLTFMAAEVISNASARQDEAPEDVAKAAEKDKFQSQKAISTAELEMPRSIHRDVSDNSKLDDQTSSYMLDLMESQGKYPNLMQPDPLMDSRDVHDFPASNESPFHNRVIVRNHFSMFHEAIIKGNEPGVFDPKATNRRDFEREFNELKANWRPTESDALEADFSAAKDQRFSEDERRRLYRSTIMSRRTKQQTGMGKIERIQVFMLVGNQDGLVGFGSGKAGGDEADPLGASVEDALKNVDYVDRFEDRTIWSEMRAKFRSTEIIMRPRPVGFGLRCHPTLYKVLKACGIKDISAKVWGSRHPLNVVYCAIRMLHAGHAPHGMGDGRGGKGRRLWKGSGMRGKTQMEMARGRPLIALRK